MEEKRTCEHCWYHNYVSYAFVCLYNPIEHGTNCATEVEPGETCGEFTPTGY